MVEQEFLRVNQGPYDIFVGELWFFCFLNMLKSDRGLFTRGFPGEGQQVQVSDLHYVLPFLILAQHGSITGTGRQFTLDLSRVQKMQTLGQVSFEETFTFTGATGFRTAKNRQKYELKPLSGNCVARVPVGTPQTPSTFP